MALVMGAGVNLHHGVNMRVLALPLLCQEMALMLSMHFSPLTSLPAEALGKKSPAPCLGSIVELGLVEETRMNQPQSHDC